MIKRIRFATRNKDVPFDDTGGLRARIEWFRANLPGQGDFVRESWFIAAREEVLA